jgi:branched-chain amino acid transport system permease protein
MSVVWVTTDVIDVATGAYAVVAGIVAAAIGLPLGPFVGIAAAMTLGGVTGLIFLGFHAMRADRDAMLIVLATFALMMVIESGILTIVGTDDRFLDPLPGNLQVGKAILPYQGIFDLIIAIAIMLLLTGLLKWTPLGLRMRASAISHRAATLSGVAAMAIGMTYSSTFVFTTVAFSGAVLLGKSGPLPAFLGGLVLGIATSVSDAYLPSGWAAAVPAMLIIVTLASGRLPATAFTGLRP